MALRKRNHNGDEKLFRLLRRHLLIGVGTGWTILTLFFILDVGGLRSMAINNNLAYIAFPMMYLLFAITFGSASMGIGLMTFDEDDDDDGEGFKIHFGFRPALKPALAKVRIVRK